MQNTRPALLQPGRDQPAPEHLPEIHPNPLHSFPLHIPFVLAQQLLDELSGVLPQVLPDDELRGRNLIEKLKAQLQQQ